jgi:hypothetical protein
MIMMIERLRPSRRREHKAMLEEDHTYEFYEYLLDAEAPDTLEQAAADFERYWRSQRRSTFRRFAARVAAAAR